MLWVEVLNRALGWTDSAGLCHELRGSSSALVVDDRTLERVQRDVALVRRAFAADYLDAVLNSEDARTLAQWVAAVTLGAGPPAARDLTLPPVCGRRVRGALPEPFETLLTTALVEMKTQRRANTATVVHRCHGVVRGPAPHTTYPPDWERRFAEIARVARIVQDARFHQCPRLIVSERGSRYCSKTCSNASFVARKAISDPGYFAQKQERYRRRQARNDGGEPTRGGAFVYMD